MKKNIMAMLFALVIVGGVNAADYFKGDGEMLEVPFIAEETLINIAHFWSNRAADIIDSSDTIDKKQYALYLWEKDVEDFRDKVRRANPGVLARVDSILNVARKLNKPITDITLSVKRKLF